MVKSAPQPLPARDPYRSLGGYGGGSVHEQQDIWQVLLDATRVLFKRKLLIASVAMATVAIGTIQTLLKTPLYTSQVRLQIDRSAPRVMKDGDVMANDSGYYDFEFMRTQIELLQSRSLAERVVTTTRVSEDAGFLEAAQHLCAGAAEQLVRS